MNNAEEIREKSENENTLGDNEYTEAINHYATLIKKARKRKESMIMNINKTHEEENEHHNAEYMKSEKVENKPYCDEMKKIEHYTPHRETK